MRHLQPGHASNYRLSGLIVIISERIVPKHDKNGRIRTRNLSPNTALASGAVEAGIQPLVEALNSSGHCHTIASCHGHGEVLGGAWISVPYTLFRSSLDFARALQHQLDPAYLGRSQGTRYHWSLVAQFHPDDDDLAWTLKAHSIRLPEIIARRWINADVQAIVAMVQRAAGDSFRIPRYSFSTCSAPRTRSP